MPEETTPTAETAATTPAPEAQDAKGTTDPAAELEALRAKYERAQKDLTKFRTRAEEVEAAQKQAEEERLSKAPLEEKLAALEAEREKLTKAAQDAETRRVTAERMATLTGKVADPKAALKLLDDDHLTGDGDVNVDALLKAYPFLAPTHPGSVNIPASRSSKEPTHMRPEDFRGKSQAWIAENLHRLKAPDKE